MRAISRRVGKPESFDRREPEACGAQRSHRWRLARAVMLPVGLLAASGCTWLIPGMNVHPGLPGQHSYFVHESKSPGAANQHLRYRVIPITPQVVASLLAREAPADAPPSGAPRLKPLLPSMVAPDYRIGPGDLIDVTVWDHPELNAPAGMQSQNAALNGQLVSSDGRLFYPYVGSFKVAGMTVEQVRRYLTAHLRQLIQDPQVSVRVLGYGSQRIEITGEVVRPETITLGNVPLGVLQAIDAAGGLAPGASRRRAILVRNGVRYRIDLAGLLSGSRLVPNPELEPGDVIHVPDESADQIFMLGAVAQQRPLAMTQDMMTLIQALTDAGGLDATRASGSGVLVFRQPTNAKSGTAADVYEINMSTPQGVLLAGQFPLRPRDVVYVQATEFAQYNAVINQLLPTITAVFELKQTVGF